MQPSSELLCIRQSRLQDMLPSPFHATSGAGRARARNAAASLPPLALSPSSSRRISTRGDLYCSATARVAAVRVYRLANSAGD